MRRSGRTVAVAAVLLFVAAVSLAATAWSKLAALQHPCPPTLFIELRTGSGAVWHRRHLRRVDCATVGPADLAPERLALVKEIVRKRLRPARRFPFVLGELRWQLAFHIAPHLDPRPRAFRLRWKRLAARPSDYVRMLLLYHLRTEEELTLALINTLWVDPKTRGLEAFARREFRQGFGSLSEAEATRLLERALRLPRRRPTPALGNQLGAPRMPSPDTNSRSKEDGAQGPPGLSEFTAPFGHWFLDYCLDTLHREGLIGPGGSPKLDRSLVVETTLDPELQRRYEDLARTYVHGLKGHALDLKARLALAPPLQAAVVAVDTSGALRALIGGVSSATDSYNRATKARRQISSTFKPFLYGRAMETRRFHPASTLEDRPIELPDGEGGVWRPHNHFPYYLGTVTLKKALTQSLNTVAVRLGQEVGEREMARLSRAFFALPGNDIGRRVKANPSLSLGSLDLTPLELAKAYLALAAEGRERFPFAIRSIRDADGVLIRDLAAEAHRRGGRRLMDSDSVAVVRHILGSVATEGTASVFQETPFDFDVALKTGSSPGDSWLAGFSPELVLVAWVGFDRPPPRGQVRMPLFTVIPFWLAMMRAHNPQRKHFPGTPRLVAQEFCGDTGCSPPRDCVRTRALFQMGTRLPACGPNSAPPK